MSEINQSAKELVMINFHPKYKEELNSWQKIEQRKGEDGLEKYVIAIGSNLGDFIEFFVNETNIISKLFLDDGVIVGFVCYEIQENNTVHIEIIGTNPNFRRMGYAREILEYIKNFLNKTYGITKITLDVKKDNEAGIKSFSKVARVSNKTLSDSYIGFEI